MSDAATLQARLARVVASEEALRAAREQQAAVPASPASPQAAAPGTGTLSSGAPSVEQRLLKFLDLEFEEEWTRLRLAATTALGAGGTSSGDGPDSPASPSDPSRRTWRGLGAAPVPAPGSGADGSPPQAAPDQVAPPGSPMLRLELPPPDKTSYGHAFNVTPLALPDADAVASAAGVVVLTSAPLLSRLSFAERRSYAADAAAFAHRLAEDTRLLLGEGGAGVRYAVAGLARYSQVRGARVRALTWLAARLKPGAPLSVEALSAALDSDALPLAVRALFAASSGASSSSSLAGTGPQWDEPMVEAACSVCAALVERTAGGAPAQVITANGGLAACIDTLKRPGGPHGNAARLLCALVARHDDHLLAPATPAEGLDGGASSSGADERAAQAVALGCVPVIGAVIAAVASPSLTSSTAPVAGEVVLPHCLGVLCACALAPQAATAALDPVGGVETLGAALRGCWMSAGSIPGTKVHRMGIASASACASAAAHSPDWAARLAACGAPACLAVLMEACETSARVQRDGCAALRHMASASADVAASMGACKAISAAIAAMRAHPDDGEVAQAAAKALACAAGTAPGQVANNGAAVAAGGIEALVAAVLRHKDSPSVLEAGYRALYAYVFNSGGVVYALEKVSAIPRGRESLLVAIGAVAVGPGARDQCMSAMGVLSQATSALRAGSDDA
jgi:hypothetical protein